MSNRELEIIMSLRDEVTAKISAISNAFTKFKAGIGQMALTFKQVGREIEMVGNTISIFGALITGPLMLAFKNSENYSQGVHDQMDRLRNVTLAFQITLATALIPVIHNFTNILAGMLAMWNNLGSGTQQFIVQGALMAGTFMTIGGLVTKFTGMIVKLGGEILDLGKKFLNMSLSSKIIWGVAAAIVGLILYWDQLKGVALPVINAIDVAISTMSIGINKSIKFMVDGLIAVANGFSYLDKAVGKSLGTQNNYFMEEAKFLDKVSGKLKELSDHQTQTVALFENNISNIFQGKQGMLADTLDDLNAKTKTMFDLFKNPPEVNIAPIAKSFDALKQIAQSTAQAMTTAMGDFFFNIMQGKLNDLQQVFSNFGQAIMQMLAQVLAKMVLVNTIGKLFPAMLPFFHSGGVIPRAHSGMLASDEMPIIAQSGEAVLSRRAVGMLGESNVNRLNQGKSVGSGGGDTHYHPVLVVKAFDVSDIMKNKDQIIGIFTDSYTRNGAVRKAIKKG